MSENFLRERLRRACAPAERERLTIALLAWPLFDESQRERIYLHYA
jgi:hypothetical protein